MQILTDEEVLGSQSPAIVSDSEVFGTSPTAQVPSEPQPQILSDAEVLGTPSEQSKPWAVTRGLVSGFLEQQPELYGHALEGVAHGAPDWAAGPLRDASKYLIEKSKTLNPAKYKLQGKSMWDIGGIGDALTWAGETFGQGAASTAGPIAAGGLGALGGGAVAGPPGLIVGGIGGALVGSAPLNYGEMYKALKEAGVEPKESAKYAAMVLPLLSGLDVAGEALPAMRLLGIGQAQREVSRGIARRIASELGKAATTEGITEGAQKGVQLGTISSVTDKPLLTMENLKAVIEDIVGGGLVGAGFGAAAGIKRDVAPRTDVGPQIDAALAGLNITPPPTVDVAQSSRAMNPEVSSFLQQEDRKLQESTSLQVPTITPTDPLAPMAQEVASEPGADLGRLTKLLGPKLYGDPSQLTPVSVKEMVQNSFDAVKGSIEKGEMAEGNIDVNMDNQSRTISITDDGAGMVAEVLGKQFLQIAGTHKESSRASGGLGIAKMLFLFGNKALNVRTMRNGRVAELNTTGESLFEALSNPSKAPKINIRVPTAEDRVMFPKGHGTNVMVSVPEAYKDDATGAMKEIQFNVWNRHPVLQKSPLFENINVRFNGEELPIGNKFPSQDFTQLANANFEWGSARIYMSQAPIQLQANVHVLSNGLWQFDTAIKEDPSSAYGPNIRRQFYIDVNPKVSAEDSGYPFDLNRQRFSPSVAKDFQKIFNYVSMTFKQEDLTSNVVNYGDMQYMRPDGSASPRIKISPKVPPPPTALTPIKPGDKISVVDGKLVVNGRAVPELTPEILEAARIDPAAYKVDQSEIDPSQPILHDNVDVKISDVETRSLVSLGREKFGKRFDTAMHDLGNAFILLRDAVGTSFGAKKPQPKGQLSLEQEPFDFEASRYDDIMTEGVGISFDQKYHGVSILIPFRGMFLNPAVVTYNDSFQIAEDFFYTMVHELSHHRIRNHDAEFPNEMQKILVALAAAEVRGFNVQQFKHNLFATVQANMDILAYLKGVMTSGTFDIQPRGNRFKDSSYQARDGGGAGNVVPVGTGAEGNAGLPAGTGRGAQGPGPSAGRTDNALTASFHPAFSADNGRAANQRAVDADGEAKGLPTNAQPAEVQQILSNIAGGLGGGRGGLSGGSGGPNGIPAAAAHASRMNRLYKYMAGLDQLVRANPLFSPLLRYYERVVGMHREESKLHDIATLMAKQWRWLGPRGDNLTQLINAVVQLEHLPPGSIQGVGKRPDAAQMNVLRKKYKIDDETFALYQRIEKLFDGFTDLVANNEKVRTQRRITDPKKLSDRLDTINATVAYMKEIPYFPFMRFGEHFVVVLDAQGHTVHYETFEGPFPVRQQQSRKTELEKNLGPGQRVEAGKLPAADLPYLGQPTMLLEAMQDELGMAPSDQVLQMMQGQLSTSMPFKRTFSGGRFRPGYSMDFQRSFAKFFFHGAKFYAKTKYAHDLRTDVAQAQAFGARSNKAGQIADYMRDHLVNNVLDTRGDFGYFKGAIFFWALGYVPAAATQNMAQTPMITFPYLAAKFGEIRATRAIVQAMGQVSTFYRRGKYATMTDADMRALDYGIKRGTISETQAADLAGLAQGNNLLLGLAGNRAQRGWAFFMEKAAWMFETAEQFNRRVAFRAALYLARENPTVKFVDQAVNQHEEEYKNLAATAGIGPSEARAIIAAVYATEDTQYVYARYARPRFMRGPLSGTLFVFKKYIQSTLFMLGNNPDVAWRFLLISMLLGGLGGIPGWGDFRDILRALGIHLFGKDFNLDRMTRQFVIDLFGPNPKLPPDMVLHGLARYGFGLPALLDLMGSNPSRGFTPNHSTNVPFPVFDRSKSITSDQVLPFSVGKLFTPSKDVNRTISEEGQRASGAVFSVGFNMYKALMDQDSPATDPKRWEKAVPRALGDVSKSYRAIVEGRERSSKGGPQTASTIVRYDPSDTENMMEILGLLGGYQNLRTQAKWDSIMAKAEVTAFYDLQRQALLGQFHEAIRSKAPDQIKDVREAVQKFNRTLPDWARGKAITADTVVQSVESRERERIARDSGVPVQRSNVGISRYIDTLFPESTVDVRRVR